MLDVRKKPSLFGKVLLSKVEGLKNERNVFFCRCLAAMKMAIGRTIVVCLSCIIVFCGDGAFLRVLAQPYCVSGKITEYYSNEPLPFTHILVNDQDRHFFADIDGNFNFCVDTVIFSLTFRTPQHKEKKVRIQQDTTENLEVYLVANSVFERIEHTHDEARALIEKVAAYKNVHNPEYFGNFSYRSYNKFSLSTERSYIAKSKVVSTLEKATKHLHWLVGKINYFSDEHHLFLMEAVTARKYRSANSQRETILASKVSGIEKPSVFVTTSLLQPFTLYSNTIYLAGSHYYSPFLGKPLSWYHFSIIDSAQVNGEKIYTVKFNPKSRYRVDFLQGYLYINANYHALVHAVIMPAVRSKIAIEFLQTYQALPHPKKEAGQIWFPKESVSKIIKAKYSHTATKVSAYNRTYYYDVLPYTDMTWADFDEILLSYQEKDSLPPDFWQQHRKISFKEKDDKTYQLYDTLGSLRQFERLVRLGEGFYYGYLPFGKINLDFHRFFDLNQHEGIRLGFGVHTNERLTKWVSIGGFAGYGINDQRWKYGADVAVTLRQKPEIRLVVAHQRNKLEAGLSRFAFDQRQFNSESARRLRVSVMDEVRENAVSLEGQHIDRYLSFQVRMAQQLIDPYYPYYFLSPQNELDSLFQLVEISLGLKYAYGEHFIQSLYKKISLGTTYPIVWLQYYHGTNRLAQGEYAYRKLEAKVQKTIQFAGWGKMNIQVSSGRVWGDAPYTKLFNGKGSFRTFAAITHNSFETMYYNEFLSDRYFYIFLAHNFGKINLRKFNKQPSIEISHNFGIGRLQDPSRHFLLLERPFKTMEKGFWESGLYLNNIFVVKMVGLFAGLGAGIFYRYGHYASLQTKENLLFKVAVDFQL